MRKLDGLVALVERLAVIHKEIIMIVSTITLCAVVVAYTVLPFLGG